jgi:hypothetical protein
MPASNTSQRGSGRSVGRFFRFSLRTLFVLVLLTSLGGIWIRVKTRTAERQQKAAEVIRELGGTSLYDWQLDGRAEPPGPAWMETLLGVNLFTSVAKVSFSATRVTDSDLSCLRDVPDLVMLRLDDTQVTDAGLEHIGALKQLCVLWLSNTKISDAGLKQLIGLRNLQLLMLSDTQITDVGLEIISEMSELEFLSVGNTLVTHDGISKLRQALPDCGVIQ